jgi:ABC-type branched-subunit amino acid transport system ATPase component
MREANGLEVDGLTVQFGGHMAVSSLSLVAPRGEITGLIGPNGAGKSTTFDACSGLLTPSHGVIRLDGRDITSLRPEQRAQLGLGRTFQRMQLFDSVSVRANVELGLEARLAAGSPWRQLLCRRAERERIEAAADEAIALCGIGAIATLPVGGLSTGQRRLVELARAIAGGFPLLLLDEPSSGLDPTETAAFGKILRHLVDQRGTGILLVEHDMSLVMSCCRRINVIDFGVSIFEGTPEATQASPEVRQAYLGAAPVERGVP